MTPDEQKALALDLISGLLKSWWTIVAGVCIGASLALLALRYTPPVFEAQARIEADVEKLPAEFVRRTVSDDVELRLRELRSAVLGPENLQTVMASAFGETPDDVDALARGITSRIQLTFSQLTRTISVVYRDRNPRRAADVTNMLAELFVDENKRIRSESAQEVRQSLEQLASDTTTEFTQVEQALTELSQKHPHELESQRLTNEQKVRDLRTQLDDHRRAVAGAKRRLSVLRANAKRSDSPQVLDEPAATPGESDDADPRIAKLESEKQELLRKVTENHPDVIAKQAEIDRLRASQSPKPIPKPAEPVDPIESPAGLDVSATWLRAAELEVDRLEAEGAGLERELQRYEGYLANTPMIQKQWDELAGRHQLLKQMNDENQRKIRTAISAEQLEAEDIGNPFVIAGFATPPSEPVFPDRMTFLGAGVLAGLFLFVGPLLARIVLRPTISSEVSLRSLSDVPVLVAIPVMPTPEAAHLRKRVLRINLGLSLLASSVLFGVVALWQLNVL